MNDRRLGIVDGTPVYPETRASQVMQALDQEAANLLVDAGQSLTYDEDLSKRLWLGDPTRVPDCFTI